LEKVSAQLTDEGFLGGAVRPLTQPTAWATLSRKGRGEGLTPSSDVARHLVSQRETLGFAAPSKFGKASDR